MIDDTTIRSIPDMITKLRIGALRKTKKGACLYIPPLFGHYTYSLHRLLAKIRVTQMTHLRHFVPTRKRRANSSQSKPACRICVHRRSLMTKGKARPIKVRLPPHNDSAPSSHPPAHPTFPPTFHTQPAHLLCLNMLTPDRGNIPMNLQGAQAMRGQIRPGAPLHPFIPKHRWGR